MQVLIIYVKTEPTCLQLRQAGTVPSDELHYSQIVPSVFPEWKKPPLLLVREGLLDSGPDAGCTAAFCCRPITVLAACKAHGANFFITIINISQFFRMGRNKHQWLQDRSSVFQRLSAGCHGEYAGVKTEVCNTWNPHLLYSHIACSEFIIAD